MGQILGLPSWCILYGSFLHEKAIIFCFFPLFCCALGFFFESFSLSLVGLGLTLLFQESLFWISVLSEAAEMLLDNCTFLVSDIAHGIFVLLVGAAFDSSTWTPVGDCQKTWAMSTTCIPFNSSAIMDLVALCHAVSYITVAIWPVDLWSVFTVSGNAIICKFSIVILAHLFLHVILLIFCFSILPCFGIDPVPVSHIMPDTLLLLEVGIPKLFLEELISCFSNMNHDVRTSFEEFQC
jgi:hypothetical protein